MAVAVGDFNGDGLDETAIGTKNSLSGSSSVLVYGWDAGAVSPGYRIQYSLTEGSTAFGASLAAGDLNLDGFDDLVVGEPHETADWINGQPTTCKVFVYHGSASGLPALPSMELVPPSAPILAGGVTGLPPYSYGKSVAITPDMSGNGFPEIIVGSPGIYDINPVLNHPGMATLYEGRTLVEISTFYAEALTGPTFGYINFGWEVEGGDFNGDGVGDAAVLTQSEALPGGVGGTGIEGEIIHSTGGTSSPSPTSPPSGPGGGASSERRRFVVVCPSPPPPAAPGFGPVGDLLTVSPSTNMAPRISLASPGDIDDIDGVTPWGALDTDKTYPGDDLIVGDALIGSVTMWVPERKLRGHGESLWKRDNITVDQEWGIDVAALGDLNSDGFMDGLAVSRSGRVRLLSGGPVEVHLPPQPWRLGYRMGQIDPGATNDLIRTETGDFNGDGLTDFVLVRDEGAMVPSVELRSIASLSKRISTTRLNLDASGEGVCIPVFTRSFTSAAINQFSHIIATPNVNLSGTIFGGSSGPSIFLDFARTDPFVRTSISAPTYFASINPVPLSGTTHTGSGTSPSAGQATGTSTVVIAPGLATSVQMRLGHFVYDGVDMTD